MNINGCIVGVKVNVLTHHLLVLGIDAVALHQRVTKRACVCVCVRCTVYP